MNKSRSVHYITVNNKRYKYILSKTFRRNVIHFECPAAAIGQDFLSEDIPALLIDLPELILAEKRYRAGQKDTIRFRISVEDKKMIEKKAFKKGYKSVSSFLRDLALKS